MLLGIEPLAWVVLVVLFTKVVEVIVVFTLVFDVVVENIEWRALAPQSRRKARVTITCKMEDNVQTTVGPLQGQIFRIEKRQV